MKTASRGLIRVISAMLCWMLLPISAFAAGGNPGAEESGIPFSDVASAEDDGLSATSVDAPEIQYEASASASPYPTETPVEENTDPIPATPDPNEEGSFLLAAKTKAQLLIAPMHIRFCFGESLAEAMQRVNGHTFSGLSEACIRAIDGVEGTYRCLNETGTVDLSRPASETKVLLLATDEDALSEEETALIRSMAAYAGSAAAQADEAASALYLTLVESYPTLSRAQMREKAKELQDAIRQESAPVIQAAEPDCKNGFYQITNGGELLWFADLINGERTAPEGLEDVKSAALLCDVSLSGIEWKPIGSRETPFSGEFCGNGHTVSDLSIRAEGDYQALFGYAAASAKLHDLSVFGTVRANGSYVAGIVAYSEASLSGLRNGCSVVAGGKYAGGVVGYLAGTNSAAEDCDNRGNVYSSYELGATYVGGIAGEAEGLLTHCRNFAAVSGYSYIGGIAGAAGSIKDCDNQGNVQCVGQFAGGIAGAAADVTDCENAGVITVSGIYVSTRSRFEGGNAGGITGNATTVRGCVNRGSVTTRQEGKCSISSVAGIAGRAKEVADCENYGAVTANGSYIAGIMGGNGGGLVLRCRNDADVVNASESGEQTGGVASAGKVEQCLNTGAVRGNHAVGGVLGGTQSSTVRCSYNLGDVIGNENVGGVAGVCIAADTCYHAGTVFGKGANLGPIVGSGSGVKNCRYLTGSAAYAKHGVELDATALRLAYTDAPFQINFDTSYHAGYPTLSFERGAKEIEAESLLLEPGTKTGYSLLLGNTPAGLPSHLLLTAGGLTVRCKTAWQAEDGFDRQTEGVYSFLPVPEVPKGCKLTESARIDRISVHVYSEETLPVITAVELPEGTPTSFTTPYGTEPEGLPDVLIATIGGERLRLHVRWEAEGDAALTDTETEHRYAAKLLEDYRLADGVQLPFITVRVLPNMLISAFHFTEKQSAESADYALEYENTEIRDGVRVFRYTLTVYDTSATVYLHTTLKEGVTARYSYMPLNASPTEKTGAVRPGRAQMLAGFVTAQRAYVNGNTLVLTAQANLDGELAVQRYEIKTRVLPTLETLSGLSGSFDARFTPAFDGRWFVYAAAVPSSTETVTFRAKATLASETILLDGEKLAADETGVVSCTVAAEPDVLHELTVVRESDMGTRLETRYELRVTKLAETILTTHFEPEDLIFALTGANGTVYPEPDGSFHLLRGDSYCYTASKYGFVAESGTFDADMPAMRLNVSLKTAEKNETLREEIPSEWNDFRGNEDNNAVTEQRTPVSAADAVLYWANQAGISYGADAVSSPILVDGYLICTAKQYIFKINTTTGEVEQTGTMVKKSAFNITPPTYAKGMLFVALADGVIQAFNAATLESIWIYKDALGGQPNAPITYRNGYIYTGFWRGETETANWVCISVTDEDPARTDEEKLASWVYTANGGFYWAGACVRDRFLIVGTDDGQSGYSADTAALLSIDPVSGRIIDCLDHLGADIRSTICYDAATQRYYFTSKGGKFFSVAVSEDGYFDRSSLKTLDLRGGQAIEGMSTSTPVVYNGRAYVGVSGAAQFEPYGGHSITVIDLKSFSIAYRCPTKGYPQTSGLLTKAYEKTGLVYVYFLENMSPGNLCVIRDAPGQKEALSIYDGKPITRAEVLFTPRGAQRQYALCSPIVDEYGTLYFKNDSGYMMALGSRVVSLEVLAQPVKTLYEEGECFEAEGLRVAEHLANGCTRDVTSAVSYSEEPLSVQDTDITLYFNYYCYNNDAETLDRPQTTVEIIVLSHADMYALKQTQEKIDAIGVVTADSGDRIEEARGLYDELSERLKELVTNLDRLTEAEETYALLLQAERQNAARVDRLIANLGTITGESAAALENAFRLYEALSEKGKTFVTRYPELLEKQRIYASLIRQSSERAAEVMERIASIGTVTETSGALIDSARDAYDKLPKDVKPFVTNLAVLEAAEEAYARLLEQIGASARLAEERIEAIGTVTLERKNAIVRARLAYDRLTDAAKQEVKNYEKLLAAEARLKELEEQYAALEARAEELKRAIAAIRAAAATPGAVNADNAGSVVRHAKGAEQILQGFSEEERALFTETDALLEQYRRAAADAMHKDAATGITVSGLPWDMGIRVEVIAERSSEDYQTFSALIGSKRVLKLYRITIVDPVSGERAEQSADYPCVWKIPVPDFNASAYTKIGVARADGASAVYMGDHGVDYVGPFAFSTNGDGLFGVVGTKIKWVANDDVKEGESVFNDGMRGEVQNGQSVRSGGFVSPGEWEYREIVLTERWESLMTEPERRLYSAICEAVEQGANFCAGYGVQNEAFERVAAVYALLNPLHVLADLEYRQEDGQVDLIYALPEEDHLALIRQWHETVEGIVRVNLYQTEGETAARLYGYLAENTICPAPGVVPRDDSPRISFYPSALYALLAGITEKQVVNAAYLYLLLQAGIEGEFVRPMVADGGEASLQDAADENAWILLRLEQQWYHADLSLDLYSAESGDDYSPVAHFGMSDAKRKASAGAISGWEWLVPYDGSLSRTAAEAPDADAAWQMPQCPNDRAKEARER